MAFKEIGDRSCFTYSRIPSQKDISFIRLKRFYNQFSVSISQM